MVSEVGDPERSVELLWGGKTHPGRGPKPALTLDGVVAAAVEVADQEGLAALSMRRVAEKLGFTTMSLYRYVPGKAELLDLMQDAVVAEVVLPDHRMGWRAGLAYSARQDWELYQRHPWMVQVASTRSVPGPHYMADFEARLKLLVGTGLSGREIMAVANLVSQYVEGAARRVAEAQQAERTSGVSLEEWWTSRVSLWGHLTEDRYPTLARVWMGGGYEGMVDDFEFGLQRVLDGIEMLVRGRGETSDRDETPGTCVTCGKPVEKPATGRPKEYCSRACQQRAYRARQAAGS
ncbi:TetR/AcrR family transcriptional regulator [Umezawaea tangerina]|uniref:TetR family transcriptional regulator n=1 Tax=Umezawaea tangerina TaxID=84725 RepID=A0A2T0SA64_9PSEU|nr:TetR/AcrR family transcriptional regulator [Umezawaea tangerina]PRY30315.1 TetR family transcriptional regulator [Umezawaea tangerina]